jgi:hypothetical protein
MLLSHPAYKLRCKPLPSIGNSDHDIVLLDIACKPFKPKPVRRKIYLWKKADIYKIKEDLESFGNTFRNIGKRDIESLWQALKDAILHILFICLSYFILNFLLESFISIDISFLLGFSSFLMSFLLPVDLSPDDCIDPRMKERY